MFALRLLASLLESKKNNVETTVKIENLSLQKHTLTNILIDSLSN